ncbi:MFS-type transporter SLC18B1-like [Ciona intestinalis]
MQQYVLVSLASMSGNGSVRNHGNYHENEGESIERRERLKSGRQSIPFYRRHSSVSYSFQGDPNSLSNYSRSYKPEFPKVGDYGSIQTSSHQHGTDLEEVFDDEADSVAEFTLPVQGANTDEKPVSTEKLYFGFTVRKLKVFLSLVLLSITEILGYSAIATFFPVVAADKGLSPGQIGLVFASYSIAGIVAALIAGSLLVKIGTKFCVLAGMFFNAGALICFGFLDQTALLPFYALSIASRGLMGFGCNLAYTAMYAIIFQEFEDRSITVVGMSETLVSIGGMMGPLVGGALYQYGGYATPFIVLSSLQFVLMVVCWYLLPYSPADSNVATVSPFQLLKHSSAVIATLDIIIMFTLSSFFASNLDTFLNDEFNMSPVIVGVTMLIGSLCYGITSPIWGYIADRWKKNFLMEIGTLGEFVAMVLIGPALLLKSWFGIEKQTLPLLYAAICVKGSFTGAALMPTFTDMVDAASELKVQESLLAQYGMVSGLWNTAFSLGDISGPLLGGLLVGKFGFENTAAILGLCCLGLMVIKISERIIRRCCCKPTIVEASSEYESLLPNTPDV